MRDLAGSIAASSRQQAEGCVKTADDLARYRRIFAEVRPKVIVETGTFNGRSALWFADWAGALVVTVDYDDPPRIWSKIRDDPRIVSLRGDSTDPEVVGRVGAIVKAVPAEVATVMVVLDSDHSAAHVTRELDAYGPLVTPGSLLVVEDTLCRWLTGPIVAPYDGTPLDAVEAWLPDHPEFAIDVEIEDAFPTTQHPSGWLRCRG